LGKPVKAAFMSILAATLIISVVLTVASTQQPLAQNLETYTVSVQLATNPIGYINILIPPDASVASTQLLGSSGIENLRDFRFQGTFNLRCYRFAQMSFAGDLRGASQSITVQIQVNRNSVSYQPAHADPVSDAIMERLMSLPVTGQFGNGGLSFGNLERAADWRGYPLLSVNKNGGYQLPQSNVKYVVITSSQTESSLNAFLDWKRIQGLEPFVMTTQTIDSTYVGESLQSKTKEFLKDAFNSWHMEYVLIVGGASTLPPISYQEGPTPTGMEWENRTTDYYHMTLEQSADTYSRDWSTMDARYPLDFPDFILGRLPSDDLTELGNMIRKAMSYEQDDNPGEWVRTNLLVAGENAPGGPTAEWATYTAKDRPRMSLVSPGTLGETSGNLTLQALVDAFNQGVGSVSMNAHASPYGWVLGGSEWLDYGTVDRLSNARLPVVFSEGCHSGKWDAPQSVAVKMLGKSIGGAVAIVAGSSYSPYGVEVYLSAYNYEMSLPVNQWRLPDADYHVGRAFFYFVALNGVVDHMNLLGDPSLVLATSRYDKPVTATIRGTVSALNVYGNRVLVEDALVVATSGNTQLSAHTQANGSFQMTGPSGTYTVTASAFNVDSSTIDGHVFQSAQDMIPVAGVTVDAEPLSSDRDRGGSGATDSSGLFRLTVRPFELLQPSSSSVVLVGGQVVTVDLQLVPIGAIEPGTFILSFTHPLYAASAQSLLVTPGQSVHIADTFLNVGLPSTVAASFQGNVYTLVVNANASSSGLLFDANRRLINFTMSGADGTVGSFVVVIPKAVLDGTPVVFVDNQPVASTYTENNTHFLIRFNQGLSTHTVSLGGSNTIPEFSTPFLVAVSSMFITVALRRRHKSSIIEDAGKGK
jgi:hypothetical protein